MSWKAFCVSCARRRLPSLQTHDCRTLESGSELTHHTLGTGGFRRAGRGWDGRGGVGSSWRLPASQVAPAGGGIEAMTKVSRRFGGRGGKVGGAAHSRESWIILAMKCCDATATSFVLRGARTAPPRARQQGRTAVGRSDKRGASPRKGDGGQGRKGGRSWFVASLNSTRPEPSRTNDKIR